MADGEAEELGKFRRNLECADEQHLGLITMTVLDECIDVIRRLCGGSAEIELAAAVSAELHKRAVAERSPRVGTA
jgi:hypothetical protein